MGGPGVLGGLGAQGFSSLSAGSFAPDATIQAQLVAAGRVSFSPVQVTLAPIEILWCPAPGVAGNCATTSSAIRTVSYPIKVAALDTRDDGIVNYDTLAFFVFQSTLTDLTPLMPRTPPAAVPAHGGQCKPVIRNVA